MIASSILDQLKSEHNVVKKLFKKAENCEDYLRKHALQEIKQELVPHARGEEKTIYSLLRQRLGKEKASKEDINLINEAYEEHRVVDDLLKELENIDSNNEKWPAHLKVIKENVEHHIEEEEKDLFNLIKKHFSKEYLIELKTAYMIAKDTYAETLPSQSIISERQPSSDARSI